ncbi:MAG: DUF255 domain-containing protein [bacterium]
MAPGAGTAWGYRHSGAAIRYLEYSQRAFDLAKRENKPVFMVISAVWCYWCKTYDEQTLEISEVASFMNRNFINVFVDLDRRQDLQHKYVTKGIPTSVIFTPDGRQYLSFSGILDPRQFLAGMSQVLSDIRRKKGQPRREPPATVKNIRPFLPQSNRKAGQNASKPLAAVFRGWRKDYLQLIMDNVDITHGGFGTGKKYPLGAVISYLIRAQQIGGPKETWLVAGHTLNLIAKHLYDSVEGGFFRYADRGDWRRLRREKMLITNVQLIRAFQMAEKMALADKNRKLAHRFGAIYKKSLGFFLATYRRTGGGFYGSLDGRTPGYYRLSAERRKRAKRRPKLDRTLYSAWNGQVVYLLEQIYSDDPSPPLREAIVGALRFLGGEMLTPAEGLRTYARPGGNPPTGSGMLSVNSWGALAFITGYRMTGEARYLKYFKKVLAYANAQLYISREGIYRLWNIRNVKGLRRGEAVSEEAPLLENGVMALALAEAHRSTGNPEYHGLAKRIIDALSALDPAEFDEDPNDPGKRFLIDFVYFLNALQRLSTHPA